MALPAAAEADDPVADLGDRLRPGASLVPDDHCTELPTAIARTGSDWTQLGMRSPLRVSIQLFGGVAGRVLRGSEAGGRLLLVIAIVTCMVSSDARVMIGALAEPEALLVFGAIVTATSTARALDEFGRPVSGTSRSLPSAWKEHVAAIGM